MRRIVEVRDLVKVYRGRRTRHVALRGVSLDVQEGELAAIVGASGSGKSTLLSLMAGLERPTYGTVRVMGQPVSSMGEDALADFRLRHAGFIFQKFNLFEELTVLENVSFPLALRGVSERERERRAMELLAMVGLSSHAHHRPDELSGGQQQRTAIARALIMKPAILFADEPTGNLDSGTADQIMAMLTDVVRRGTTLLMVTHDMGRVAQADRVIHIRDGQIEREDSAREERT